MVDLCLPCHERGVVRAAKLRLDGIAMCNACARGGDSAGVRRSYTVEPDLNLPTAEPRLERRADRLPLHLSPEEFAELKAAGVKGQSVRMHIPRTPLRSEHGTLCLICSRPGTNVFHTAPCPQRLKAPVAVPEPITGAPAPVIVKRETLPPDTFRTANPNAAIVKLILEETAAALGMQMADYRVQRKSMPYVVLRQMAAWLLREHTALSMSAIGRLFGHQHHTTIISGVNRIADLMVTDRGMSATAELIWKNACRRSQRESHVKEFQETSFAEGQAFARNALLAGMRDVMQLMEAGAA